jgi:hypothetical protein
MGLWGNGSDQMRFLPSPPTRRGRKEGGLRPLSALSRSCLGERGSGLLWLH